MHSTYSLSEMGPIPQ